MNKRLTLLSVAVIFGAGLVFGSLALAQSGTDSQPDGAAAPAGAPAAPLGSDSNPSGSPEVVIPEIYRPGAASMALAGGPTSTVYFTPQDEDTSTTVLFLYSTSPTTSTVALQTFKMNGSLNISTTIAVPPQGLVRLCADSVSTVSASWTNVVLVNFTTDSAYAKMTVPAGIKAEGYVVWNGTGDYDPLIAAPTLPLRFSSDPASVFLPLVQH